MSEQQDVRETLQGAGGRLREARVAKGLSPEDIAAQLYLRVTLIHDIENENYDKLPPAPFIHGYLRNYAKLVGLSCDQVVNSCEMTQQGMPSFNTVSSDEEMTSNHRSVKAVTWFIVLVLLVLLAVWWVNSQPLREAEQSGVGSPIDLLDSALLPEPAFTAAAPKADQPASSASTSGPSAAEAADAPQPVSAEGASSAAGADSPEGEVVEGERVVEGEPGTVAEPVNPTSAAAVTDEEAAAASVDPEADTPASDPTSTASSDGEQTTVVAQSLKAGDAQAELRLEIAKDCWTEARDSAGRALYFNVAKAGSRLTLKGSAPFSLLLGNADQSKVFLNGEPVSYSGRGVVRLTVGSKADNSVPGQ